MKRLSFAVLVFAVLAFASVAYADLLVKDGGGANQTIKNFVCETTKLCNATTIINSSGVEVTFNNNGRTTSSNSSPVVSSAAPTSWHLIAATGTNATSVKASAATLFSCQLGNVGTAVAFLKIYNKASSPTVGTDTPVKTLIIPKAGTAADGAASIISFGPGGLTLGTGFAAAVTGVITDADATGVAASSIAINCDYE